jgi:3-hydroxyisobutyrate dehydrogenase-like beta-hydroxyacid dehydrogenase
MKAVDFTNKNISVIGLGAMGTALARTMIKNGVRVTVWNRTAEKAKALSGEGAIEASTAKEAIASNPVSIICLSDNHAVRDILYPLEEILRGKTLINLTNGTPEQAREIATWLTAHSVEYLDGGIMAIPPMIGTPQALIFYSGSASAFEKWSDLLGLLGTARYLKEDPGLASLYDISLLIAMYGMFAGFLQAAALARANGVNALELTPLIISWLQAMTQTLPLNAKQIDTGDYELGVVSNLGMQTTAYENLIETCKTSGVSIDLMLPLKMMFERAVANGYSKSDISVIVENILTPAQANK